MSEEKEGWGEYGKLVLKELERLNDNHEKMRNDQRRVCRHAILFQEKLQHGNGDSHLDDVAS